MVGRWSRLNGLRSGYVLFQNRFKIELTKRYNMVSIMDSLVEKYIKQMDDKSKKVYKIAKENLESSFSIEKSIGFKKWKRKNNT